MTSYPTLSPCIMEVVVLSAWPSIIYFIGSICRPAAPNEISWALIDRCTHRIWGNDHRKSDKVIMRLVY